MWGEGGWQGAGAEGHVHVAEIWHCMRHHASLGMGVAVQVWDVAFMHMLLAHVVHCTPPLPAIRSYGVSMNLHPFTTVWGVTEDGTGTINQWWETTAGYECSTGLCLMQRCVVRPMAQAQCCAHSRSQQPTAVEGNHWGHVVVVITTPNCSFDCTPRLLTGRGQLTVTGR
jgi:hypothetical protein